MKSVQSVAVVAGLCSGVAMAEKPEQMVMAKQQSPHFYEVASQLELGGLRFSYDDKAANNALLTGALEMVVEYMDTHTEFKGMNAQKISDVFTLDAVKASGSSASQQDGYVHYRTFNYMPEVKSMYTQAYTDTAPSIAIQLAPAGADLVLEMHINGKQSGTLEKKLIDAMGPAMAEMYAEAQKEQAANPMVAQYQELVKQVDSRMIVVADLSPEGFKGIPGFPVNGQALFAISNAEMIWNNVKPLLAEQGVEIFSKDGVDSIQFPAEIPSWEPILQYDSKSKFLYLASSADYLTLCQNSAKCTKDRLEDDPHYKKVQGTLPKSFSNMAYVSPEFSSKVMMMANLFAVPQIEEPELQSAVQMLMQKLSQSAVTKVATIYVTSPQDKGTLHVVNTPVDMPSMGNNTVLAGSLVGVSTLFVGASYYRDSANEAACEINQAALAKGIDSYCNIEGVEYGEPLDRAAIMGENGPFADQPMVCPAGGEYIWSNTYKKEGNVTCTCGAKLN